MNYEREPVHFKVRELNFELALGNCKLAQHCPPPPPPPLSLITSLIVSLVIGVTGSNTPGVSHVCFHYQGVVFVCFRSEPLAVCVEGEGFDCRVVVCLCVRMQACRHFDWLQKINTLPTL